MLQGLERHGEEGHASWTSTSKAKEVCDVNSWFRTQDIAKELITLSYEDRPIVRPTASMRELSSSDQPLYMRTQKQLHEVNP